MSTKLTRVKQKSETGLSDNPCICVRRSDSGVRFDGVANCSLGYRIGTSVAGDEEGIFAWWRWDGARLIVRNDRYGFFPLFYVRDANGVCVSPSLVKLLECGVSTELNTAGLAVFLRLGWFIGDETPFKAIRAFPPGATLEWQDGNCRIDSSGPLIVKPQRIGYDEAVDGYVTLFRAAIRRCAPPSDKFAVPLSGGRDSRHILLELCEAGFKPAACVTQRKFPAIAGETAIIEEDVEIAGQLCRALGIRHVIVEQSNDRLSAELRNNWLTGFCAMEHAWGLPFADQLSAWDYAYDGIGGDVLSAGGIKQTGSFLTARRLALFESGDFEALAHEILERDEGYLPHFLPKRAYRQFSREVAIQCLMDELGRHADAPNPVSSFFFNNRTRRSIALGTLTTWGQKTAVFMPYLDHALYDFLTSLPAGIFLENRLHTEAILRAHPQYASIPFESSHQSPTNDSSYVKKYAFQLGKYCLLSPKKAFLRRSSVALRAIRCLVDRSYAVDALSFGPLAVYLKQLGSYL